METKTNPSQDSIEFDVFPLREINTLKNFICDDIDLDDFFANDAFLYGQQLLGKTYYCQVNDDSNKIIAAFTVANDSIKASLISSKTRNLLQRKIPNTKRTRSYPAILIGRLGVNKEYKGKNIGSQVLDYIKMWFSHPDNKSGCRFIVVDAYNHSKVISFYEKNGFKLLYPSDIEEKEIFGIEQDQTLHSRLMYYDLIRFINY